MELKKKLKSLSKYFGRIFVVASLFMVLGVFSSHCYALTPISEIDEEFFDIITDKYIETFSFYKNYSNLKNNSGERFTDCVNRLKSSLDPNITPYIENLAVVCNGSWIYIVPINNTIGDTCPILKVTESYSSPYYWNEVYFINDNLQNTNFKYISYQSTNKNGLYQYGNPTTDSFGHSMMSNSNIVKNSTSDVFYIKTLFTFNVSGSVYVKRTGTNDYIMGLTSDDTVLNYKNSLTPEPEPEEPSGDTPSTPSGDSGDVNIIDYTNQLNNINTGIVNVQNQISGDTTKIIDNQIQNTQTIVNTISGETQKITNTLTEPADMDNTTITSGDIERFFRF